MEHANQQDLHSARSRAKDALAVARSRAKDALAVAIAKMVAESLTKQILGALAEVSRRHQKLKREPDALFEKTLEAPRAPQDE